MKKLILLILLLSSFVMAENSKGILVVSFGTSYKEAEQKGILPVEKLIRENMKDRKFYRAFTSSFIRKKILKRDGIKIFSPTEVLEDMKKAGIVDVVIQPLHIIPGAEYEEIVAVAGKFRKEFTRLALGSPLLSSERDYKETAEAVAGVLKKGEPCVLMGHGTHHKANSCYSRFQKCAEEMKLPFLMGTVEGHPELKDVISVLEKRKIKSFRLAPFMLVAGDHALNDMAGDEDDSWKVILRKKGFKPDLYTRGLGENLKIRQIFLRHALEAEGEAGAAGIIPAERIKKGSKVSYTDPEGREWSLPFKPPRVVFCHNSLLEIWYMAGGEAVGRVKGNITEGTPEERVPVIGLLGNPGVERIVSVKPDLVVLSGNFRKHEATAKLLESAGIKCLLLKYTTYSDFLEILELFSYLNGTVKETGKLLADITTSVDEVVSRKREKKPSVLLLFATPKNITCELPAGSTGFCIRMLGGRNIAEGAPVKGGRRVMYSMEKIVAVNPDVILIKTMGDMDVCRRKLKQQFNSHGGWGSLKAVKEHRIHYLPKKYFMYKPNRAYPAAFRYLYKLLYPVKGKA